MRRILAPLALSLWIGGSAAALAGPTLQTGFLSFNDFNMNHAFDCGEQADFLVTFADDNPNPTSNGYRGRLRVPVNPSQLAYYKFRLDPTQTTLCSILNVISGSSQSDTFVDVDFSCQTLAPPNNHLALSLIMTAAYTGPIGPIFYETTADVDTGNGAQHFALDTPYFYYSLTACTRPDLALQKSDGGITSAPGKTIPYTLTVSNIGLGPAPATLLHETVPPNTTFNATASSPGWTCTPNNAANSSCSLSLGNVVSGASTARIFSVAVGLNLAPNVSLITNTAFVDSQGSDANDTNPANNTATDTTPLTPGVPDLAVTKTTSSTGATPGSTITWTLSVANSGNAPATNTVLNETLPAGTTFVPALSSTGWTCTGSNCTASLGTLLAGTSTSRQFSVQVSNPVPATLNSIQNTACASTAQETNTSNNCGSTTTSVGVSPLLQTQKSVTSGTGTPGTVIVWGITISNTGNRDAAAVAIHETVPVGTTFTAASSSAGWTCAPSTAAGSTCTLTLASLAGGGGSAARTFATTVDNPLPAGQISVANTVCASTTGSSDACSIVTVPTDGSPNLAVRKSLTSGDSSSGSVDVFTLTVQNTGNQDATGVVLTEAVPTNTTFAPAQSSPEWTCQGSTSGSQCSLTIPTLAGAGGTTARTFAVTVDNPLAAGVTSLTNTACVGLGTGARPVKLVRRTRISGGACDTITVTPNAAPVLRISKKLTAGTVSAGQAITYTLNVSNTGNQNADGVVVTDTIPAGVSWTGGSSGWTCQPARSPSSCSLTIGPLNAGASVDLSIIFTLDSPIAVGVTSLTNKACVSDGARQACDQVTDPVIPSGSPALAITKTYTGGPLRPGATLPFHLHVSNSGTASANAVRLVETVPANTTFAAAASSPGWACVSPAAGSSCTLGLTTLAAGATADVVFAVVAANPLPDNVRQIANTACVQDNTGQTIGCDQTSTPLDVVLYLSLRDTLHVDADHDGNLTRGDTLRYTLLVSNTSDQPATNAVITTAIDGHLTLLVGSVTSDTGSVAAGNSPGDSTPRVLIPSLAPGATVAITFDVQARAGLAGVTKVSSQASTDGDNFQTTKSDDPDTPAPADPTDTPVGGPAVPAVPTLSQFGLIALALALALASLRVIRRRAKA